MKNLKEFAIPTVALFLICLIATALLGITNEVTAPKIAELAEKTEIETRQLVLPDAQSFGDVNNIPNGGTYVEGRDANGNKVGYVFVTTTKGYGGDVKMMTGISLEGKVTGVSPLELSETAGLGMKAQNESFLNQFKDKVKDIAVNKNNASGNEIQALTGATITSNAVTGAVNAALDYYDTNLKEAQ